LRRSWAGAVAAAAGLLIVAGPAAAQLAEPVSVTADAPATVAAGAPFRLRVDVAAEPGALDIAAQPLRLRVRLGPECGGSFAGTEGPTAIDRVLPAPAAGAAYSAGVTATSKVGAVGEETVCAFLEDGQERQFATDTEATIAVTLGCPAANRLLSQLRRRFAHLNRRIAKLRRLKAHALGSQRRHALARRDHRLRRKRRKLIAMSRRARHEVTIACGAGRGG
jgi:hypothetical protein